MHCSGCDRAAASALGRVHLYMTGTHAAFEHAVCLTPRALPPSSLSSLSSPSLTLKHCIPRKGPDNLMPPSYPPLPSPPHRFPRTRYLVRTCKAFPLRGSEVSQRFLSTATPSLCRLFPPTYSPLARLASEKKKRRGGGAARLLRELVYVGESLVT